MRPRRRRPTRKPRIPRGPARRVGSPQHPRGVEHFFVAALQRINARVAKAIAAALYKRVADFAKPETDDDGKRMDAPPPPPPPPDGDIGGVMKIARKAAEEALREAESEIESTSATAATRTLKFSQAEFGRLKIPVKKEPALTWLIKGWTKDNVARIKGMTDDQLDKIERILGDGYGMRHETLAKEIARQVEDVSESRAEFIARDAVLTLNGQITRERQTAAQIEKYVWTTSNDERVRPEHEALDGKTFSWDEGDPDEGHPGEAPMCRCTAFPILPELDGAGGDEGSDE